MPGECLPGHLRSTHSFLGVFSENPIHLGSTSRTRSLGGTPTIFQFDFLSVKVSLFPAFYAITVVTRHS